MSSNPRNKVDAVSTDKPDASEWKSMSLGSTALKDDTNKLVNDYKTAFVINHRNAELIRDAAQHILDNPQQADGKDLNFTINIGKFFDPENLSANVRKYFTHRVYVTKDSMEKIGKTFADYIKS